MLRAFPLLSLLIAFFVSCASTIATGQFQVSSLPELVQCGVAQVSWSGTQGVVGVRIRAELSDTTLKSFEPATDKTFSLTWAPIDVPAGCSVVLEVSYAGRTVASAPSTVQASSDSSCLSPNSTTSGGAASGGGETMPLGEPLPVASPSSAPAPAPANATISLPTNGTLPLPTANGTLALPTMASNSTVTPTSAPNALPYSATSRPSNASSSGFTYPTIGLGNRTASSTASARPTSSNGEARAKTSASLATVVAAAVLSATAVWLTQEL